MAQTNPMTASISFQGNIACGGSASLVLKDDGTCTFHGSLHDSGLVPYDVSFALVVNTKTGNAFSFAKNGTVYGTADILTDSTKSRDFTWNDTTQNAAIAAAWSDIVAGFDFHWKAEVNVNLVQTLGDVVNIVKVVVPAVQSVVAVI